jgi:excisionase family DNA binding protein
MDNDVDPSATYPIEEVAALKGVPYATVRCAILRGEVPAIRRGRAWLVRGVDVVAWRPRRWTPVDHDADR